jgi:nicotinic acid mononucleotide adenylyltransferase/HD superfamily phosphodiesterase
METLHAIEIHNNILYTLLNSQALEEHPRAKNAVRSYIESRRFKEGINFIVMNKSYSCKAVLELCAPLLEELSEGSAPPDWLFYSYQYALGKSFPNVVTAELPEVLELPCTIYLNILRIFANFQKLAEDGTWQSLYPVALLTEEEENSLENPAEYKAFVKAFQNEYVYEMMKLSQEVMGYNTLDHICGVCYLASFVGRQLKKAGFPVDMGRVVGSALGHDIGKYGCKTSELKRVPYLHYYYTDQWFKKHGITYIGHIATNHSTWDLELENLPLESLILIYADFRVKNRGSQMHVYDLQRSFDVILAKLDNVDEKKEKRYKRVYAKLKDFEDYLISMGVRTEIDNALDITSQKFYNGKLHYSLMYGHEILQSIKYLSIHHNINLMHQLRDEASLNDILELARSESDWKRLREYIRIFEEYSTYLTPKQKLITLKFLYELLVHPEEDIRRQCAELIGLLIASFDEEYRKEVPQDTQLDMPDASGTALLDKYMEMMLNPDHKVMPMHRSWIAYNLIFMLKSLFKNCRKKQLDSYICVLAKYYDSSYEKSDETKLYLLEAIKYISLDYEYQCLDIILSYLQEMLEHPHLPFRLASKDVCHHILNKYSDYEHPTLAYITSLLSEKLKGLLIDRPMQAENATENFINLQLVRFLDNNSPVLESYEVSYIGDLKSISSIFLSNLKSATNWTIKRTQIDLILDYTLQMPEVHGFYTAMHLCNLLKVSSSYKVRNRAGDALINIIPYLSLEQRNDVAIELLRALEIEGYQFAEYIPNFLGKLILFLQPIELDEFLQDFESKIKQSGTQLNSLLLRTIGIAIANYHTYGINFYEPTEDNNNRLIKMLGIVLNGLVHFDNHIKQVSFSVLCREIFGNKYVQLETKYSIFKLIAKKMLTMLTDNSTEELAFLTNSSGLNDIYTFICDYIFYNGSMFLERPARVAFFPGTFDPFSLSHKEIAKAIRNQGFEVYLSVDEFSWSKRTLPNLIRKNIINMSIADELNIYLYPEDFPVNIANPSDLRLLRLNFDYAEVYIVIGSDVVLNASSYKLEKRQNSIHTFSHVVFDRKNTMPAADPSAIEEENKLLAEALKAIEGNVVRLTLPPQYEDISSTQIRSSVDENRDITTLIDSLAQRYIYENGFYKSEPQYKSLLQSISVEIDILEEFPLADLEEAAAILSDSYSQVAPVFESFIKKPSARMLLLRDGKRKGRLLGFTLFHRVLSPTMYQDIQSIKTTDYLRNHAVGKMLMIDGIFAASETDIGVISQVLLTETLAFSLAKDYEYAIFKCALSSLNVNLKRVQETLKLQGFFEIPSQDVTNPFLAVNMSNPCAMILDARAFIKEPIKNTESVKRAIITSRKRLQSALTQLYPGNLVISFNRHILYETITRKICHENKVPTAPIVPRKLGPAMCVPYGNILNKSVVPNTVTKSLHTEKMFSPDMKSFDVGCFPHYLDLDIQIKMIKSFRRPIILIDDILHKGYRIKKLDPLFKKEHIEVQKILVGILSGQGKELMDIQNREVDSAYFIPKLKAWFTESNFYPYIGGDALWRGYFPQKNLLPSINLILPFTSPTFLMGATKESVYNISEVALENTLSIMNAIEREYQMMHERSLTLNSLGQVLTIPRCPDHGKAMAYDFNAAPSVFIKNNLELLRRLKNILY